MPYRDDIEAAAATLAANGKPVLVRALLSEIERARASISSSKGIRQADRLLVPIRAYLAGQATEATIETRRAALEAGKEIQCARYNTQLTKLPSCYQHACLYLADIIADREDSSAYWVVLELAAFWADWPTRRLKVKTKRDILGHLRACQRAYLEEELEKAIALLPTGIIESRSRLSTLAI